MAREMKDSGIEWIGEIPREWETARLKTLFSFGKGLPITKENLCEFGVPVISYGQIHSKTNTGVKVQKELIRYVSESYLETNEQSLVNESDFIFADTSEDMDGCGNCVYVDSQSVLFAGYHTIILHSRKNRNNRYLAYLFKADNWRCQIRGRVSGVKVFSISRKILSDAAVLLPPVSEQQTIADFLDNQCSHIDSVIEKTHAAIEEYKKLKQAVITQAVTKGIRPNREMKDSGVEWIGGIPKEWNVVKIKHLGEYRNGLTYNPTDVVDKSGGVLVLRSSNIQHGKLCLVDNVYVNMTIPEQLMVKKGDIVICSRNGSKALIGKCAVVEESMVASFGAFMMSYRCKSSKYMYYILNSEVFKYHLNTFLTATINQLTGGNFGNMSIVWCNNESEQSEIVAYLDEKTAAIDSLIQKKEQLITELEAYKKSLIYEYVTGKKEVPVHAH